MFCSLHDNHEVHKGIAALRLHVCKAHVLHALSVYASHTQIHRIVRVITVFTQQQLQVSAGYLELDLESVWEFLFEFLLHCY